MIHPIILGTAWTSGDETLPPHGLPVVSAGPKGNNADVAECTALKMDVVTKKSGHQMTGMAVSVCITPAAPSPSPSPIPYPTMGTVAEGQLARVVDAGGATTNLRFAGQRADTLTGLHYNRHRYDVPELGVFMTPDPLGIGASPHDIGFVANATEVVVSGHGAPGVVTFGSAGMVSGNDLAQRLNNAGFDGSQPGAKVAVAACNSATPGTSSESVAQGVADGTGATTHGARANDVAGAQSGSATSGQSGFAPGSVWVDNGSYVSTTAGAGDSGVTTHGSSTSNDSATGSSVFP